MGRGAKPVRREVSGEGAYFPFELQVRRDMWERLELGDLQAEIATGTPLPPVMIARQVAARLNRLPAFRETPVQAGLLNLYAVMLRAFRHVIRQYTEQCQPGLWLLVPERSGYRYESGDLARTTAGFAWSFSPPPVLAGAQSPDDYLAGDDPTHMRRQQILLELLILRVGAENRAIDSFRALCDDEELAARSPYRPVMMRVEDTLRTFPVGGRFHLPLPDLLRAPLKAAPDSLVGQLEFIQREWRPLLPPELLEELATAAGIVAEESRQRWGGAGPPQVLEFARRGLPAPDDFYPEPERFSADLDWMPNVVLMAKMVYVWLGQLSRQYGREVARLDQIPDEELDRLARWGFSGLWLIGIWERSPASQKIKQLTGNPEAIASAYSLFDYQIAGDLGGWEALANLRDRALRRGIRLASDMVPNHTGIYSRWMVEHPDWFIQLDYPPYPTYRFGGPDLSSSPEISLNLEEGYWDKSDAAVVFKHYDHRDGRTRYIYHGNDGTSTPWNDTAQLDYLNPEVRDAVIQTILHVARNFPIIRFDAAMTLAKKHYQRLWFPQPGFGSGVPSRAEHGLSRAAFDAAMPEEFWRQVVDRVAAEVPDTLLLAEAFWLMEGYFVRTLGMHRVYNSAFMNMLKLEENAKYRQTIKNVLEFNPEILKRFVNFMNNPDERTAIEQFGKEKKYFGAAVLLVTMPGLPMFGHGQIEGFHEKYGMEYKQALWDEPVDEHLVAEHKARIFPLLRQRRLFSGSEHFVLYDFFSGDTVDENVFAYSNRAGDRCGLIIYHNKYAETAGWVRTSCARAVPENGGTVLRQSTVGEALGVKADGWHYYTFRDYANGLEYIRHGREVAEQGLYVSLDAYEYHAFLDFQEIRDDDFGTWGQLCRLLDGRGVPDIAEEVKLIRYGTLIGRFRELLAALAIGRELSAAKKVPGKGRRPGPCRENLEPFLVALAEAAGVAEPALAETATAMIAKLERPVEEAPPLDNRFGRLLLAAMLICSEMGRLAGSAAVQSRSADWFGTFGLRRALVDILGAAATDTTSDAKRALVLADILLAVDTTSGGEEEGTRLGDVLRRLVAVRDIQTFLLVHRGDGHLWFVQEPYEQLLDWLRFWLTRDAVAAAVTAAGHSSVILCREADRLREAARTAGYRFDLFVDWLRGEYPDSAERPGESGGVAPDF